MLAEVYRRAGAWKVRSVSAGWTEGLAALLREHGVQVDDEPATPAPPPAAPTPPPVASGPWVPTTGAPPAPPAPSGPLAWAPGTPPPGPSGGWPAPTPAAPVAGSAVPTAAPPAPPAPSAPPAGPGLQTDPAAGPRSVPGEERLSLQKRQTLNLRKEQVHRVLLTKGATGERARVVLVIDKTGSMSQEFASGLVHRVVERMVPVATQIDTDGSLETYLYATKFARLPDLRVGDMEAWTSEFLHMGGTHGGINYRKLGAVNDEIPILTELTGTARRGDPPTLVLFFTDGGFSKKREITRIMKDAAGLPIFWEFVGLGANNYGLLEKLDDMGGREVDNVDFFAVDDIDRVDDAELYRRLLTEFPGWLTAARARGIVAPR
ncbi:stress protein [Nakamurella flava]|uniref:Stress protein n=1 Tax=Nakamurella flava TaxID=2576308 RepID=A0A4V6CSL9_9ACTN|nr:stress protein [Nakamurella flava]